MAELTGVLNSQNTLTGCLIEKQKLIGTINYGNRGPKGDKGDQGPMGVGIEIKPSEELCVNIGDCYIDDRGHLMCLDVLDPRHFKDCGEIRGPRGEKGDTGDTGPQGPQGEKGDTGEKGEKGDTGEKGEKGDQGIQGEKGDKGDTGSQGAKGDTGNSGVYLGEDAPTDPTVMVWIEDDGQPTPTRETLVHKYRHHIRLTATQSVAVADTAHIVGMIMVDDDYPQQYTQQTFAENYLGYGGVEHYRCMVSGGATWVQHGEYISHSITDLFYQFGCEADGTIRFNTFDGYLASYDAAPESTNFFDWTEYLVEGV